MISLQDMCIDNICDNLNLLCEEVIATSQKGRNVWNEKQKHYKSHLTFKQLEVCFPSVLSDKLLRKLNEKNKITDSTLELFGSNCMRLRFVELRNARNVTVQGLRVLKKHKIILLDVAGVYLTLEDVISCLGEYSVENLRSLNISRIKIPCETGCGNMDALTKLRCLRSLNVSYTPLDNAGLKMVVDSLSNLDELDISGTDVNDITPLLNCQDRLKSLSLYNMQVSGACFIPCIVLQLHQLRVLELSCDVQKSTHCLQDHQSTFFRSENCLIHLSKLDISGLSDIDITDLIYFLSHHNHIKFLGLFSCIESSDPIFMDRMHNNYNAELAVTGLANEKQVLTALKHYTHRPKFLETSLIYLARLKGKVTEAHENIIQLVLSALNVNPYKYGVQLAGTSCLLSLIKCSDIHATTRKKIAELLMNIMERFRTESILSNCIQVLLYGDFIPYVPFDKFHCAQLVMEFFCSSKKSLIDRLCVSVLDDLVSCLTSSQSSQLGSEPRYIKKLLGIVKQRSQIICVDITMDFTLGILWSLTDESASACSVLLKEGGKDILFKLLRIFKDDAEVESKVLGLFNNIAEVPHLRSSLMYPAFVERLRNYLYSDHSEVSYSAAAIISHLASAGVDAWTIETITRNQILTEVGNVVANWKTPDKEMLAFSSFRSFIPILSSSTEYEIQLWAVWALRHVCTKNESRYCTLMMKDGLNLVVRHLYGCKETNVKVKEICKNILDLLENKGYDTAPT